MLIWSIMLLGLGVLAVLDSQFNYGHIFRSANSFIYMLLSLGILIRTRIMGTQGYREQLVRKNIELQEKVEELQRSIDQLKKRTVEKNVPV
jgi:hypothetical protein